MQWRVTRLLRSGVLETNQFQDIFNIYHLHLEIICARHRQRFRSRHAENSAQRQDRSQHPSRGSLVCSFLMRDAVTVKVTILKCTALCRPSAGARAASSALVSESSRACPKVLQFVPTVTLRELETKIALADSICRMTKKPYTLSREPCSLSKLNYSTAILVALVVGGLGGILFLFSSDFWGV